MYYLVYLLLILGLSACLQTPAVSETENSTAKTLSNNLENNNLSDVLQTYFIVHPLPQKVVEKIRALKNWSEDNGTSIWYPILPKTSSQSGLLSQQYGDARQLFLIRQEVASGGGGYRDYLFSLDEATGELLDQRLVGADENGTQLEHQTIWVDGLNNYVWRVSGKEVIEDTTSNCAEVDEYIGACLVWVSDYFIIDDIGKFQPILSNTIQAGRSFPFVSNSFLKPHQLQGYSKVGLTYLWGEIYAQYGYSFEDDPSLKAYFEQQTWYKANEQPAAAIEAQFSLFEQENAALLAKLIAES